MSKAPKERTCGRLREGDLVTVGKGVRVYRVRHVFPNGNVKLAADAAHPAAAKRVTDEFRSYRRDELTVVTP